MYNYIYNKIIYFNQYLDNFFKEKIKNDIVRKYIINTIFGSFYFIFVIFLLNFIKKNDLNYTKIFLMEMPYINFITYFKGDNISNYIIKKFNITNEMAIFNIKLLTFSLLGYSFFLTNNNFIANIYNDNTYLYDDILMLLNYTIISIVCMNIYYFYNIFDKNYLISKFKDSLKNHDFNFANDFYYAKNFYGKIYNYFYSNIEITKSYYILSDLCSSNNLKAIKWLYTINPNIIENCESILNNVALSGNIEIFEYLLQFENNKIYLNNSKKNIVDNILYSNNHSFIKFFNDKYNIEYDDLFLNYCCENNDYKLVKFILKKMIDTKININNDSIISACNHLMKNFHTESNKYNDTLNILQLLYKIGKKINFNIRYDNDILFRYYCEKYLETTDSTIKFNLLNLINWLYANCQDYKIIIEDNEIIGYKIQNNLEQIKDYINGDCNIINFSNRDNKDDCAICFNENKYYIKLKCNHEFCVDCFDKLYNYEKMLKCSYCQYKVDLNEIKLLIQN